MKENKKLSKWKDLFQQLLTSKAIPFKINIVKKDSPTMVTPTIVGGYLLMSGGDIIFSTNEVGKITLKK